MENWFKFYLTLIYLLTPFYSGFAELDKELEDSCFKGTVPSASNPVYLWVYGHHYQGGGGIYPNLSFYNSLAGAIKESGIPVTMFMDGIGLQTLKNENLSQFNSLVKTLNEIEFLEIGNHGEETHGPYPVLSSFSEGPDIFINYGKGWKESYLSSFERAQYSPFYTFIPESNPREISRLDDLGLNLTTPGSLKLVADTFPDKLKIATAHGVGIPAMQVAFKNTFDFPVVQGSLPFSDHALPRGADPEVALGITNEADILLHMNTPLTMERSDAELPGSYEGICELVRTLNGIDRSRPRFLVASIYTKEEDLSDLKRQWRYLKDRFLPANPGSKFILASDLLKVTDPSPNNLIDKKNALDLSKKIIELLKVIEDDGGRLPNFFEVNDGYYSIVESITMLQEFLLKSSSLTGLPSVVALDDYSIPLAPNSEFSKFNSKSVELPWSYGELYKTANNLHENLKKQQVTSDPIFLPLNISCSENPEKVINIIEYLYLLAQALESMNTIWEKGGRELALTEWDKINIDYKKLGVYTEYSDFLSSLYQDGTDGRTNSPQWEAQLQLWTIRPLPFK